MAAFDFDEVLFYGPFSTFLPSSAEESDGIQTSTLNLPTKSESSTRVCLVCEDVAGQHKYYGGQACHSCRDFFRASVALGLSDRFKCTKNGDCQITRGFHWSHCRPCFFSKCERAGMKRSLVLRSMYGEEDCRITRLDDIIKPLNGIELSLREVVRQVKTFLRIDSSTRYLLKKALTALDSIKSTFESCWRDYLYRPWECMYREIRAILHQLAFTGILSKVYCIHSETDYYFRIAEQVLASKGSSYELTFSEKLRLSKMSGQSFLKDPLALFKNSNEHEIDVANSVTDSLTKYSTKRHYLVEGQSVTEVWVTTRRGPLPTNHSWTRPPARKKASSTTLLWATLALLLAARSTQLTGASGSLQNLQHLHPLSFPNQNWELVKNALFAFDDGLGWHWKLKTLTGGGRSCPPGGGVALAASQGFAVCNGFAGSFSFSSFGSFGEGGSDDGDPRQPPKSANKRKLPNDYMGENEESTKKAKLDLELDLGKIDEEFIDEVVAQIEEDNKSKRRELGLPFKDLDSLQRMVSDEKLIEVFVSYIGEIVTDTKFASAFNRACFDKTFPGFCFFESEKSSTAGNRCFLGEPITTIPEEIRRLFKDCLDTFSRNNPGLKGDFKKKQMVAFDHWFRYRRRKHKEGKLAELRSSANDEEEGSIRHKYFEMLWMDGSETLKLLPRPPQVDDIVALERYVVEHFDHVKRTYDNRRAGHEKGIKTRKMSKK